jgi:hypothetical protein
LSLSLLFILFYFHFHFLGLVFGSRVLQTWPLLPLLVAPILTTSPRSVHTASLFPSSSSSSSPTSQSIMPKQSAALPPPSPPQQQEPNRQATSSHMMKTTKRGRPFLKVFPLYPCSLSPAILPFPTLTLNPGHARPLRDAYSLSRLDHS